MLYKVKKFHNALSLLFLAIFILFGSVGISAQPRELVVGYAAWTMSQPFIASDCEALKAKINEINAQGKYKLSLKVTDAGGKREKMLSDIEDLLVQSVDILLVLSMDSHDFVGWKDIVDKNRKETGKPLVYVSSGKLPWGGDVDTELMGVDFSVSSVDFDSGVNIGEHFAAYMYGKKGKYEGKVVVLRGVAGTGPDFLRYDGFRAVIDQYPDMEVVFEQSMNWNQMEAFQLTRVILQKFAPGTIDAIFSLSDQGAMGALQAVTEAGREGEFLIYSHDGQSDVVRKIQEGRIAATSVFHIIAPTSLERSLAFLEGEKIDPVIGMPEIFITEGNVNQVLKTHTPFVVGEDVHWELVDR